MLHLSWYEITAIVFGIASVWFSKIENILVYPVGLVSTLLYVYISVEGHLFGEASVNVYYSVVSVYGWILWYRKDAKHDHLLRITFSSKKDWFQQIAFFLFFYIVIYLCLSYLKQQFAPGALPMPDAFASAAAFTGMWLMARKKVESWYWWLLTDFASVPLYYVKGFIPSSIYYLILFIIAIFGLREWQQRAKIKVA